MTGVRYKTIEQFRRFVGSGTTEFKHEWVSDEHRYIYPLLFKYHDVVPDEHGRR